MCHNGHKHVCMWHVTDDDTGNKDSVIGTTIQPSQIIGVVAIIYCHKLKHVDRVLLLL